MRRFFVALLCVLLPTAALAGGKGNGQGNNGKGNNGNGGYRVVWDDFRRGFTVDSPDAKWFHFNAGPFVGDDGIVTTSNRGLHVRAAGTNPVTGKPAFTKTVAPESQSGLPGGVDHVKWLVYMNHMASSGVPGHDAEHGKILSCESWIRGRTWGTEQHPFGTIVENPNADLRLASFAMNTIDFETFMVYDFFITNEVVYAFYERLPFGRDVLGNYASFSHMIPVARRNVNDQHHLKISYDRSAGTVSWYLDDKKVFEVDRIGYMLDREYVTLDHGGQEEIVDMKQMSCGMGLFTLLDAHRPSDIGLVRLSEVPGTYYDPQYGEPTPAPFYDDYSAESSRLWGQGAEMQVLKYVVSSKPAPRGRK